MELNNKMKQKRNAYLYEYDCQKWSKYVFSLLGSESCHEACANNMQQKEGVLPGVEQHRVDQIHDAVPNAAFVQIGVAGNAVGRFRAMMQHVPMPVHVFVFGY